MADRKELDLEEMEEVSGGNRFETYADGNELLKRGILTEDQALSSSEVRDTLHKMGYNGYKDKGGLLNDNVYTDKDGNEISRKQFWDNFDAENGTKVIK